MNILFVTLCPVDLSTSAMLRNKALIQGFVNNGNKVSILTIESSEENSFYDKSIVWNKDINIIKLNSNRAYTSLLKEEKNILGIIKKKIIPLVRQIYHYLSIFDNTVFIAKAAEPTSLPNDYYDLIISSSDPKSSHIAVERLIKKGLKYNKWIQYWGDPLTLDITRENKYPISLLKKIESNILTRADAIIYVSPLTLEKQKSLFPSHANRMKFIPIPYLESKIYNKKINSKAKIGYFGDYPSGIRNLFPFYEACEKQIDEIEVEIVGNSDLNLSNTENIMVLGRKTRNQVEYMEEQSDILVCLLNKTGTQIPGKLYHYAATDKAILVILDGEYKEEIKSYLNTFNRYLFCENNEESIYHTINEIKNSEKRYKPSPEFHPNLIAELFIN